MNLQLVPEASQTQGLAMMPDQVPCDCWDHSTLSKT